MLSICHNHRRCIRSRKYDLKPCLVQFVSILSYCLFQKHICIYLCPVYLDIAGGCLGCLDQILYEFFQSRGLPWENFYIFLSCLLIHIALLQQINIVDYGCKRGLYIVGYICYEFCLQMLALYSGLNSLWHAVSYLVEVCTMCAEYPEHFACVRFPVQIALRHLLCALI